MSENRHVLVTGASGFVGSRIVRELLAAGFHAHCLVRDREKFEAKMRGLDSSRFSVHRGDLWSDELLEAARGTQACIHLVGIIQERARERQTFQRIHVEGTQAVLLAADAAGIRRFLHMSALGTRADAVSEYHRTKFAGEECVRASGLDYTIFQPSLIHGPEGEFVRELLVPALRDGLPPFLPFFGDGRRRLQPVYVEDLARVFVRALTTPAAVGKTFPLGGGERLNWRELWEVAREIIPGASRLKPKIGVPLAIAKAVGAAGDYFDRTIGWRLGIPFNLAQVQMSQEDNVCEIAEVESVFGVRLRGFREALREYAATLGRVR